MLLTMGTQTSLCLFVTHTHTRAYMCTYMRTHTSSFPPHRTLVSVCLIQHIQTLPGAHGEVGGMCRSSGAQPQWREGQAMYWVGLNNLPTKGEAVSSLGQV